MVMNVENGQKKMTGFLHVSNELFHGYAANAE